MNEHAGHRQRMRERFEKNGLNGFSEHEMLEMLLFYAIPQRNTNPLGHQLLNRFGSLHGVMDATLEELCEVDGIGRHAATLIVLVSKLMREVQNSRQKTKKTIKNRWEAQEHCEQLLRGLQDEYLYAVCLNGQMELVADAMVSHGTVSEVQAYPREVAKAVLRHNARVVVLCHNHPGGNAIPSVQDLDMTRQLSEMLARMDVILADHIIVTETESISLHSAGLITHTPTANSMEANVAETLDGVATRKRVEKMVKEAKKKV